MVDIAKQVEQILTAVFNINKRLKGRVDMTMALGLSDIKAQMGGLVYRGFVTGNGFKRLGDTLRYLQAIENDWKTGGRSTSRPCSDAESRKRPAGVAAMDQQTTACTS